MEVRDAGDRHNGTHTRFLHFHLIQTVKLVKFADLYLFQFVRLMVIHNHYILIDLHHAVVHLADPDAAHILVVVDGTDQYLGALFRIPFRRRNILKDRIK